MIQLKVVLINILTLETAQIYIYLSIINHVSGDAVYFYPSCIKASFKS
jgi:hypothetical protein